MKTVGVQFANDNVSAKIAPGLNSQPLQQELKSVAAAFVDLQQARHDADYNLSHRLTRQEANSLVDQAEQAFADWLTVRRSIQADAFLVALLAQKNIRG